MLVQGDLSSWRWQRAQRREGIFFCFTHTMSGHWLGSVNYREPRIFKGSIFCTFGRQLKRDFVENDNAQRNVWEWRTIARKVLRLRCQPLQQTHLEHLLKGLRKNACLLFKKAHGTTNGRIRKFYSISFAMNQTHNKSTFSPLDFTDPHIATHIRPTGKKKQLNDKITPFSDISNYFTVCRFCPYLWPLWHFEFQ